MPSIEEYLSNATPLQLEEFERIHKIIRGIVPGVEETMAYGIPTFRYKDRNLAHFGYFKDHVSLFPGSGPIEQLKGKLTKYNLSKGTIQYDENDPIPEALVKELIVVSMAIIDSKR